MGNKLQGFNSSFVEGTVEGIEQIASGMRMMFEETKEIKNEIENIKNETNEELNEVKKVQKQLEKNITLTRGEEGRLKSAVLKKANHLTDKFFKVGVSNELYSAKRGHTTSYIWIVLKNHYDVSTYPQISHIEFENAMKLVNQLSIESFPEAYYRLTPTMQRIAKENNDRPMHVYFGEDSKQEDLFY